MSLVDTDEVFLQGCALFKKAQYDEALSNFDSILQNNPEHFDTLCMKSSTLSKLGKLKEALSVCEDALKINSKDLVVLNNKGFLLSALDDQKNAIETFDYVLKREPENVSVLYNKALCYSRMQKYNESVEIYDKILEIKPNSVSALFNKANDLLKFEKFADAIKAYEKLLFLSPNHKGAQNNKLIAQSKQNQNEDIADKDDKLKQKANASLEKILEWTDTNNSKKLSELNIDTELSEILSKNSETASTIVRNIQTWVDNNMPSFDYEKKFDANEKKLANAMKKHIAKNDTSAPKISQKKKSKSNKSKLIILILVLGAGTAAMIYANPDLDFDMDLPIATPSFEGYDSPDVPDAPEEKSPVINTKTIDTNIQSSYPELENSIENIYNKKRTEVGRGSLESHPELHALALRHSMDMAKNNRLDRTLSGDGLSVAREHADKIRVCVDNAEKSGTRTASALNIFGGNIPIDALTADEIFSTWLKQDVKETVLRNSIYENVGTGVSVADDGTLYVSQIYC